MSYEGIGRFSTKYDSARENPNDSSILLDIIVFCLCLLSVSCLIVWVFSNL